MKNLSLLFILMLFSIISFAQGGLGAATIEFDEGKLADAKVHIDEASKHPKASLKSKTWFYRGQIYAAIAASDKPDINKLDPNAANVAYDAYKKAMEMEPEKKGFYKDAEDGMKNMYGAFFNQAAISFDKKDYKGAMKSFETAQKLKPNDTTAYVYAAIAAGQIDDFEGYTRNIEPIFSMPSAKPSSKIAHYPNVISHYLGKKDYAKALKITEMATKDFPKNVKFVTFEAYINQEMDNMPRALELYNKISNIDPNSTDGARGLGAYYFELARKDANKEDKERADKTLTPAKSTEYDKKIKASLLLAIPHLEKVAKGNPKDLDILQTLAQCYQSTDNKAKLAETNKKIEALK